MKLVNVMVRITKYVNEISTFFFIVSEVSSESTVSANYDDFRKVFSTEKATNDNLAMTSPMILSSHSEKNLSDNKNNSSKVIKYTTPSLKNNDTLGM